MSVHVNGAGDLVINGDGAGNCVQVNPFGGAGAPFTVEGFPCQGGATEINGVPNGSFVSAAGAVINLKANLGGGDDTLLIGDKSPTVSFPGDIKIHAGGGNDHISISGTNVDGDAQIETGGGDDTVNISGSSSRGSGKIELGGGNDTLNVASSSYGGSFDANGGGGTDDFNDLGGNTFTQAPKIVNFEL